MKSKSGHKTKKKNSRRRDPASIGSALALSLNAPKTSNLSTSKTAHVSQAFSINVNIKLKPKFQLHVKTETFGWQLWFSFLSIMKSGHSCRRMNCVREILLKYTMAVTHGKEHLWRFFAKRVKWEHSCFVILAVVDSSCLGQLFYLVSCCILLYYLNFIFYYY